MPSSEEMKWLNKYLHLLPGSTCAISQLSYAIHLVIGYFANLAVSFLHSHFYYAEEVDPRTAVVTEFQLSEISHDVGTCWRELGSTLTIANAKLWNLDMEYQSNWEKAFKLLIMWKEEKGSSAQVGRLADHLKEIGRTSIAEKLLGKQAMLESG